MAKSGADLTLTEKIGARVAEWLRQVYERDAAKRIAADFGVSPNTAKSWLAGAMPANSHIAALVARFGREFLAFVFEPVLGPWPEAVYEARLEAVEKEAAALRRALNGGDNGEMQTVRRARSGGLARFGMAAGASPGLAGHALAGRTAD